MVERRIGEVVLSLRRYRRAVARGVEERAMLPTLADTMRQHHELAIYCSDCRHSAILAPLSLAQRVGEDFPVVDLYRRHLLKCTACGSRNATIRVSDPHAPFTPGWHTRPSA
jgi:hypothetical protein